MRYLTLILNEVWEQQLEEREAALDEREAALEQRELMKNNSEEDE